MIRYEKHETTQIRSSENMKKLNNKRGGCIDLKYRNMFKNENNYSDDGIYSKLKL
jgi:hypothetical protein